MPSPSTIRRWIDNGDLEGKIIGGNYYVLVQETTGDPLVDSVLQAS